MSQYATADDMKASGLPAIALSSFNDSQLAVFLQNASSEMDGYFNTSPSITLPLITWGNDIKQKCIDIACWLALKTRGFDPENDTHKVIRVGYTDAIRWCEKVSVGPVKPLVTDSSVPANSYDAPQVISRPPEGW